MAEIGLIRVLKILIYYASSNTSNETKMSAVAGFAPASQPKVVVVVVINEPKGEAVGGGQVAAPVFARVVARSLRLIGVMPTEPQEGTTREQLVEVSDAV